MRCLKSRSTLIRERIIYWEGIKNNTVLLHYALIRDGSKFNIEQSFNKIDRYNRLINRMYNLLKKRNNGIK